MTLFAKNGRLPKRFPCLLVPLETCSSFILIRDFFWFDSWMRFECSGTGFLRLIGFVDSLVIPHQFFFLHVCVLKIGFLVKWLEFAKNDRTGNSFQNSFLFRFGMFRLSRSRHFFVKGCNGCSNLSYLSGKWTFLKNFFLPFFHLF